MRKEIDTEALLRNAKGYATRDRRRVLDVLVKTRQPATAKKIHSLMGRDACDLATIHRILAFFLKAGIVRSVSYDGISRWFDLRDSRNHHHHVFCTSCGRIEDIPLCHAGAFTLYATREKGYEIDSHSLELFGRCPKCRRKRHKS